MSIRPRREARHRLVSLALVGLALVAAASGPGPRDVIEQTVERVLEILRDTGQTQEQRRAELEKLANERFDFRTMARLVLARNWKKLSDEQQEAFVDEFTEFLANDYGSRLDRYEQEEVAVLGEEAKPRGDVVVKTKIVGGEQDGAMIDYRLRNREDQWRIIDVVVEGISLVANFRDQFREVMGRDGPEALLEKLREKNAMGATEL